MKPEDRRLFHQFKKFHKMHYELHGHNAPSHQLAQGIVSEILSGIPAKDAETITAARVELLAAKRLKDLCKQLGLAILIELQTYKRPEAPEYPPPPPLLHFPSCQENQRQVAQQEHQHVAQQEPQPVPRQGDVNPDVKPPRRLATSYLGKLGLLHMIGTGDKEHIFTKVLPGTTPLQDFDEDDPVEVITIDYETDDTDDADDLSEVLMMMSAGGISKEELQGLLADIMASHQKMAKSIDALAARVKNMSVEPAEEVAVVITTEMGHVRGLSEVTQAFNKAEVGFISATGVRKVHEYQCLKGKREEVDIIPYRQLEHKFGVNKRMVMECSQGYKYCYLKGVPTKVAFMLTKPEEEEEDVPSTTASTTAYTTAAETTSTTT